MKDWEKELYIYRLDPAPPGKKDLQEYIALYYTEKDKTYFSWFLHYYEKVINTKILGYVQRFAMHGHFADLKQAYVEGMMKALKKYDISRGVPFIAYKEWYAENEIHKYIRTMRTGFIIYSKSEYGRLRKAMRKFNELGGQLNEQTIVLVAERIKCPPEITKEIIQAGLRNMQFVEYYRQYSDEDSEESREEIAWDETSDTEKLYLRIERAEEVMSTFEALNYRERAIVADHLGFCMDCYATEYRDEFDLDANGRPKRKKKKPVPFIELAVDHGLASPDSADKIYRRALEKMRKQLQSQK